MKTVAIVGVGLIGGSFGLALRKAGFSGEIFGVSSEAAIEAGLEAGAISRGATLEEAANADLIYLSQPVNRILETLESLGRMAAPRSLITDAGSTKEAIVRKASECVRSAVFIGGHPLAGKEQRGAAVADAELFRGRLYVLTPSGPEAEPTAEFRSWLQRIGANVIDLPAAEHDAVLAFTSHLPQLIATGLAATLEEQPNENLQRIFGPGLLDMTRLARSSPELWESILSTNRERIGAALDVFLATMLSIRRGLESEELGGWFERAARFANAIRNLSYTTGLDRHES